MPYSEDVLEKMNDAQEAIEQLLDHFDPDAFVSLRSGYGEIRRALKADEKAKALKDIREGLREVREEFDALKGDVASAEAARRADREIQEQNWKLTPKPVKFHWILDAIGQGPCTMSDLTDRVKASHPDVHFWQSQIEPLAKQMMALGEVERVPTGGRGRQPRWLYRRPAMSEDVARLDRALNEGEAA